MKVRWLCLALLMLILAGCGKKDNITPQKPDNGAFSLGSPLQSSMVVQRDKPFIVWGTATAKMQLAVNVSWNLTTFNATADASGKWKVTIPASPANANPQTITVKPT